MSRKILIVDDHVIFREGLRSLLEKQLRHTVIGEAGDGIEASKLATNLHPEIIIMDVSMPDMSGIEATRRILRKDKTIKIIGLSMHTDKMFITEMLNAGASAYLLKECALEELATALKVVLSGHTYLSPRITSVVLKSYLRHKASPERAGIELLTPTERTVFQLVVEGKTSKEIAYMLGISLKTVDRHRQRVLDKLKIKSVAELVKFALREGMTTIDR